jgi:hypothetical protein
MPKKVKVKAKAKTNKKNLKGLLERAKGVLMQSQQQAQAAAQAGGCWKWFTRKRSIIGKRKTKTKRRKM